jgi:hypothetical protein
MEFMDGKWLYFWMIFFAIVMFWAQGQGKRFKAVWARPLAGLCGIIAVGLAILQMMSFSCQEDTIREGVVDKEMKYLYAAMRVMGEQLGEGHEGSNILLITNRVNEYNQERHDAILDGLKSGLDGRATIGSVIHPEPPEGVNAEEYYEEEMFTAEMMNKTVADNTEHDMIVSLLGLPFDFAEMTLWQMEDDKRPKLGLAFASVYELQRAIKAGYVGVVIAYNPNYVYDIKAEPPEQYREAFDQRYLLITPENVNDIAATHPSMFKPQEVEPEEDKK